MSSSSFTSKNVCRTAWPRVRTNTLRASPSWSTSSIVSLASRESGGSAPLKPTSELSNRAVELCSYGADYWNCHIYPLTNVQSRVTNAPMCGLRSSRNLSIQRSTTVSYTHLRAHETPEHIVCRLLLEKKK